MRPHSSAFEEGGWGKNNKTMDTPHMDKVIEELERYKKIGILMNTEKAKLDEYREIKQALRKGAYRFCPPFPHIRIEKNARPVLPEKRHGHACKVKGSRRQG